MPLEIRHSRRSRTDLHKIWLYTATARDDLQADAYLRDIQEKIGKLIDFPEIGPGVRGSGGRTRKLAVREHLVFYRIDGKIARIVRVVHRSSDWQSLVA